MNRLLSMSTLTMSATRTTWKVWNLNQDSHSSLHEASGKKGLVGLGLKYAWCEIYTLMGKPVRNAPFEFEFGTFGPANVSNRLDFLQLRKLDHQWRKIESSMQRSIRNLLEQLGH